MPLVEVRAHNNDIWLGEGMPLTFPLGQDSRSPHWWTGQSKSLWLWHRFGDQRHRTQTLRLV